MLVVVVFGVFLPIIALIVGVMLGRSYERAMWQRYILSRSGFPGDPGLDTELDAPGPRAGGRAPIPPTT